MVNQAAAYLVRHELAVDKLREMYGLDDRYPASHAFVPAKTLPLHRPQVEAKYQDDKLSAILPDEYVENIIRYV